MSSAEVIPGILPKPREFTEPFWAATARGELIIQRCGRDQHYEWTPQNACSHCLHESLEWTRVSGKGRLYSYSVVHRPASSDFQAPYVVAIVELDEGPMMLTRLVGIEEAELDIGMGLQVEFVKAGPFSLYCFGPDRSSSQPVAGAGR
jgi:uncharacterized protein